MDAYGCSICLEILFEPITMPCNHKMCKPCFAKNLELTNLHCPFCKKRIGTWCRKAKNLDNLVDKPLWTFIQENYATELQNRIKGDATTLFEEGGWTHEFTFEDGVIGNVQLYFNYDIFPFDETFKVDLFFQAKNLPNKSKQFALKKNKKEPKNY